MKTISIDDRKRFFNLLYRNSSPDFIEYLRAYEGLPRPQQESFEISCELVDGVRIDSMRLAILHLQRQDVLGWFSACHRKVPLIQDLLFENATDDCFGIGLADYPSAAGVCRIKLYNFYRYPKDQTGDIAHIRRLFSLLSIPDDEFRKDRELFKKVEVSGIDWDPQERAMIKVYFGPFALEQLFVSFSHAISKEEIFCYDILRQKGILPETFIICARYSPDGRSLRTGMRYRTRNFAPYLKMFDHQRQATKFVVDFYRIFPGLDLQVINMQLAPVEKLQFYFLMKN